MRRRVKVRKAVSCLVVYVYDQGISDSEYYCSIDSNPFFIFGRSTYFHYSVNHLVCYFRENEIILILPDQVSIGAFILE